MKLDDWLKASGVTVENFAEDIGHKPQTVYRYILGHRLPKKETFRKIFLATGGKVTPNDFLDLA